MFTSRTLGYPSSDVPARWVNELYPDRRRIFTSKANPVAPFEPEVKRQAVMALCTRQVSTSEIGNNGVPPSMPLTRHKSLFLSETKKHAERVVTW